VSPSQPPRRALSTALSLVALLAMAVIPGGSAQATPTLGETEQQLNQLSEKMETISEEANTAKSDLADSRERQSAVQRELDGMQKQVDAFQQRLGSIGASAYRSGRIGMWTSLVSSGSPQDFLDQLTVLEQVTLDQKASVADLLRARKKALDAKAVIDKEVAEQAALEKTLRDRKAQLASEIDRWDALRDQLTRARGGLLDDVTKAAYGGQGVGLAAVAVRFAFAQLGKPYSFGADGPGSFDCSGLTMAAWARAGVSMPHSARKQYRAFPKVSRAALLPGDLVIYYRDLHHVALYIGDGKVIHAPTSGQRVKVAAVDSMPYYGAVRPS
jgi:cell wall-associated NlpC family hydrolase